MPKPVFIICSQSGSEDKETHLISLFQIIEHLVITKELRLDVKGRDVLLVDDILDTGKTVKRVLGKLRQLVTELDRITTPEYMLNIRDIDRKLTDAREAARAVHPIVGDERTHVMPNSIDASEVDRVAATPAAVELPQRFVLFVGKLSRSKGAWLALDAYARRHAR